MALVHNTMNLFPTPLLRFAVPAAGELNRLLLDEIAERRRAEPSVSRSNRRGWHSASDFFERTEPGHQKLAATVREAFATASEQFFSKDDLAKVDVRHDGWVNVNPKGAYNSPHEHPGAFWSGCYYVNAPKGPESSGKIAFLSPFKPLYTDQLIHGPLTNGLYEYLPRAGTILLFPANMTHWVHPNESDEERVTIAFNATFRPPARRKVQISMPKAS